MSSHKSQDSDEINKSSLNFSSFFRKKSVLVNSIFDQHLQRLEKFHPINTSIIFFTLQACIMNLNSSMKKLQP